MQSFPLGEAELRDIANITQDIERASLHAIDDTTPFVVECDASAVAVFATLNQGDRSVAYMSQPCREANPTIRQSRKKSCQSSRRCVSSRARITAFGLLFASTVFHCSALSVELSQNRGLGL